MDTRRRVRAALKWSAGAVGFAAAAYGTYVGAAWVRYGHAAPPSPEDADPMLDRFMPTYDVAERHHIRVAAPSDITRGLLAFTKSLGWSVLADLPGREIVMGTVTQPWHANVVFRPLTPDQFVAFDEPDYVKIAWTLRADPIGGDASIFRHETRVTTTDGGARAKFRRYWSLFSPGIKLIRWLLLGPLRREAERRA